MVSLRVPVWRDFLGDRDGRNRGDFQVQHAAPNESGVGGPAVRRSAHAAGGRRVLEGPQIEEEEKEGGRLFHRGPGHFVTVRTDSQMEADGVKHLAELYRFKRSGK